MLPWQLSLEQSGTVALSHLDKSEPHVTRALNVVFFPIVGIFLVIRPTQHLTITFLIFSLIQQPFEILLLAHDSASAFFFFIILVADTVKIIPNRMREREKALDVELL